MQAMVLEVWIGLFLLIFIIGGFTPFLMKERILQWIPKMSSDGTGKPLSRARGMVAILSIIVYCTAITFYAYVAPQIIEPLSFAVLCSTLAAFGSLLSTWLAFYLPFDGTSQYIRFLEYSFAKGDVERTKDSIMQLRVLANSDSTAKAAILLTSAMSGPLGELVRRTDIRTESFS